MILGGSDGANMVEAFTHCDEWQTPRGALGAVDHGAWLRGAPNPAGQGRIPPRLPRRIDMVKGSDRSLSNDGFTPSFDSAGGYMVVLIRNMAMLQPEDRAAITQYLKELP